MRLDVEGASVAGTVLPGGREFHLQHSDDALSDVVLHRKDVLELPVIAFGPQMCAGGGVNELYSDAYALCRALHAAFQQVSDAQRGANLLGALRHTLVDKRGVTRDDEKAR